MVKNRTFQDLSGTFAELEHDYNKSNIKNSWNEPPTANAGILLTTPLGANSFAGSQGDTRTQVLKYPFVDSVSGNYVGHSQNF